MELKMFSHYYHLAFNRLRQTKDNIFNLLQAMRQDRKVALLYLHAARWQCNRTSKEVGRIHGAFFNNQPCRLALLTVVLFLEVSFNILVLPPFHYIIICFSQVVLQNCGPFSKSQSFQYGFIVSNQFLLDQNSHLHQPFLFIVH